MLFALGAQKVHSHAGKKQVQFMREHPECTICSHDVDVFDSESGKTLYLWSQRFGRREGRIRELVRYGNYLSSVSVMVRRSHLPEDGYDDRIRIGSDWLLWLEVLARGKGRICYLDAERDSDLKSTSR